MTLIAIASVWKVDEKKENLKLKILCIHSQNTHNGKKKNMKWALKKMFCHLSTPRKTHLFSSDRSSVWIFCPLSQTTIPDTYNIPTSSKLPRGKSLEVESHYVLLEQKLQFDLKCWQHLTFVYRNHHTNVASVLVTCTICNGEIPKTRDS